MRNFYTTRTDIKEALTITPELKVLLKQSLRGKLYCWSTQTTMNFEVLITKPSPTHLQKSQSPLQNEQKHQYSNQARPSSSTSSSAQVSDAPALQDPLSVLLSLAESYFDTAQRNASKPDFYRDGYNSLMSTGFNCLAASLLVWKTLNFWKFVPVYLN